MKKLVSIILVCLMLLTLTASAAPSSKTLFKCMKNTLICLAKGDYSTIVSSLPVSGISPDADEWEKLATRSFSTLYGSSPQTKYAVAYSSGSHWRFAIPVETPDHDSVEVLFLDTEDGTSFCGYGCSTWKRIVQEYSVSDNIIWNEEYLGHSTAIETDSK